jgi:hypothetical protein
MTDFTRRTHVVRVWENPPPPGSSPETLGTGTSIDDEVMEIGRARHRKDRSLCPLRFGQGRAPVRSPALGARIRPAPANAPRGLARGWGGMAWEAATEGGRCQRWTICNVGILCNLL